MMAILPMDVADAVDMSDECRSYYDRRTDELVLVFTDAAEDLPEGADLAEASMAAATSGSP